MSTNINSRVIFLSFAIIVAYGCKKDWLEAKPSDKLAIPTNIIDCRAILDNFDMTSKTPLYGEIGTDNIYIPASTLSTLSNMERNSYLWASDIYQGAKFPDWYFSYQQIFYANLVLETLDKITRNEENELEWDNIKGSALFCRAYSYYNLVSLFANQYDPITSSTDQGVPLRLTTDINIKVGRSTVDENYTQILDDLTTSIGLLPSANTTRRYSRPDRLSAYAMLSRVYLAMNDYSKTLIYTDSCLQINKSILDYNTPTLASGSPIAVLNNPEMIYQTYGIVSALQVGLVDTVLYKSYDLNDLRRKVFFVNTLGNVSFKGNYTGSSVRFFTGLANDEIMFNRAESFARLNNIDSAITNLNSLMIKRWKSGLFIPFVASTKEEAITLILRERRKELLFRNIRWTDLRRLNKDSQYALNLQRIVNSQTYSLPSNSNKYTLPIPDDEILLNGISQNPR